MRATLLYQAGDVRVEDGAERIILMGRHAQRTDLGREFGATDVVASRGQDGISAVGELTGGAGTDRVLECVGLKDALIQSAGVVRDGGTISRVGAPQYPEVPLDGYGRRRSCQRQPGLRG